MRGRARLLAIPARIEYLNMIAGYWKNGVWTGLSDGTRRASVMSLSVQEAARP